MRTLEDIMIHMVDIMLQIGRYHEYIGDWELFSSLGSSLTKDIYFIAGVPKKVTRLFENSKKNDSLTSLVIPFLNY